MALGPWPSALFSSAEELETSGPPGMVWAGWPGQFGESTWKHDRLGGKPVETGRLNPFVSVTAQQAIRLKKH